ncbi:hypothetical protein MSG28_011841 [Choristoneura fumiferana]|uniref:Uncharacterized protein n=1 Tax=Choristoneura fumiferana TaxID=7141 RepID=A0ACC0KMN0_CHOFU|nr:hypothetical protein MSG28_011841 [Choristoneura fumiferana]
MSNWARRMHRRAATLSNVVTSCGHPNTLPYPRRLEKVKFGAPLHEVCKEDLPGPLLVLILKLNKEAPLRRDVFRAPGHQGAMKKLIHFLQTGRLVNVDNYSVYTIASVLKKFLRLLLSLPVCTQRLLVLLFGTGMTSEALGVSVAPSFFHSCVSDGKTATMEDVQRFKVATRIMRQLIEQFSAGDLFGRDNYEYYARVTGRILRVKDEWICSFRDPPPPRHRIDQEAYARQLSLEAEKTWLQCECDRWGNKFNIEGLSKSEECQSMPALMGVVGGGAAGSVLGLGIIPEHSLLDSCTRLSISLEESVHERQRARMRTRSEWFLQPAAALDGRARAGTTSRRPRPAAPPHAPAPRRCGERQESTALYVLVACLEDIFDDDSFHKDLNNVSVITQVDEPLQETIDIIFIVLFYTVVVLVDLAAGSVHVYEDPAVSDVTLHRSRHLFAWEDNNMNVNGHSFLGKVYNIVKEESCGDTPLIRFEHPKDLETNKPTFRNQLFGAMDPYGLSAAWILEAFNTSHHVLKVFGIPDGDGIFSPGGSMSMLYAIVAARFRAFPEVKSKGMRGLPELVLFTSEDSHYSIKKAAHWLGFGTESVRVIKTNAKGQMIVEELELAVLKDKEAGKYPLLVNATAGTTVLGAIDPLQKTADVCKKYGIWMHVDACWGGSLILSQKHKSKLNGIERAHSISWNPHKMAGAPLQCSVFLVREKGLLHEANSAAAQYLFQQDKFYDVSYDTGDKSIQCGRKIDAFKLWMMWKARGDAGLNQLADHTMELAQFCLNTVAKRPGFRLVCDDLQCPNITCLIKECLTKKSLLMVAYSPLRGHKNFFRLALTFHPVMQETHILEMLASIEECGEKVSVGSI